MNLNVKVVTQLLLESVCLEFGVQELLSLVRKKNKKTLLGVF